MKRRKAGAILLTLMLVTTSAMLYAQHNQYAVTVAGINIGTLNIKRSENGALTKYEMSTKIKLWLFFRIEAEYHMTAVYRGEQMISSTSRTRTNKGDFQSSTEWDGNRYVVKIDAYEYKKDTVINEPINFNVGRMYFDKPTPGQKIYADNFGLLIPAEKREQAIVVRIIGNANTYYYRDGTMYEANMYHPLKNYRVKLIGDK